VILKVVIAILEKFHACHFTSFPYVSTNHTFRLRTLREFSILVMEVRNSFSTFFSFYGAWSFLNDHAFVRPLILCSPSYLIDFLEFLGRINFGQEPYAYHFLPSAASFIYLVLAYRFQVIFSLPMLGQAMFA